MALALPARATRRLIMQKARSPPSRGSCSLRAHGFRFCFTPLAGFFSPFPHGTRSLSVSREYLALPDGPGGFAQNFSCSALLRIPLSFHLLRLPGCHRLWPNFPERSSHKHLATAWSYNPTIALPQLWFGLFPVRSPLLGESLTYFLFLQVLRCFSSLRLPYAIA